MTYEEEERLITYLDRDVSTMTTEDIAEFRLLLQKKTDEVCNYARGLKP